MLGWNGLLSTVKTTRSVEERFSQGTAKDRRESRKINSELVEHKFCSPMLTFFSASKKHKNNGHPTPNDPFSLTRHIRTLSLILVANHPLLRQPGLQPLHVCCFCVLCEATFQPKHESTANVSTKILRKTHLQLTLSLICVCFV